jgi:exopolysaccharide production protein ExoZ
MKSAPTFLSFQRPTQIWSVQYLRAAAALSVLVFHKFQDVLVFHHDVFHFIKYGVDLFFVISGFIMLALTQGRPIAPKRFIYDRLTRIVPLYWLVTAVVFLLVRLNFPIYMSSSSIPLFFKSLFFIPSDNGHGHIYPTLFLGWTLNYEMFFYTVFCLTLFLRRERQLFGLTIILASFMIAGVVLPHGDAVWLTYTTPRLADFLGGAWLAWLFYNNAHLYSSFRLGLLSLIIVSIMSIWGIFHNSALVGALSIGVLTSLMLIERADKLPKWPLIKFIGDASFSIYLFQEFAFDFIDLLTRRIDAIFGLNLLAHIPERLFSVLAALGLGSILFLTVERPLTNFVRKVLSRRSAAQGAPMATWRSTSVPR